MFTAAELAFLDTHGHGRLTTLDPTAAPRIHPVAFSVDPVSGTVDITGARLRDSQKYRNARLDPRVTLVVDDPELPLRGGSSSNGRGVEIHGLAELAERSGVDVIRIQPVRLTNWNVGQDGRRSRFVS